MKVFISTEVTNDEVVKHFKEVCAKHNTQISVMPKDDGAGPLNAPIDMETLKEGVKIITLSFQAGTAAIIFLRELLKGLKPGEKIVVKDAKTGESKGKIAADSSDKELEKVASS